MKNKIKNKYVLLELSNSTKRLDLSKLEKAPDMPQLKPSTVTVNLRMPLFMLNELKLQANKQDVPYQSYMKILLARALNIHSSTN
ncbi:MAG: hypothetical protein A3G32_06160 [Deltaproteobacteria bacterium RIFCSPLOWO2_12_FULL_40_28]|nr:MAG: hypothetical protein A3C45_02255 [Deltaproteobacteria bacterium RIFCSPHIGHO2_02_FULL_40_28]OGQ19038.1 MAG: hypothetical protein A3E27_05345 [Deltaproteobacteria bacterium RIFCSPHIGHO2_12_FULL_40_32]OGQ40210.1 MAG: hypothetical protein A3I69_00785 [Deltaproteobacteria bacterium RIFCSPLOWO2_02_FULL_40_36]OGQ53481.1 MAG: hypothetical protein A3G32_06160 [Deltaproteobacteria bacterium RIFCSPLOWO2_12_FULL_40_28]